MFSDGCGERIASLKSSTCCTKTAVKWFLFVCVVASAWMEQFLHTCTQKEVFVSSSRTHFIKSIRLISRRRKIDNWGEYERHTLEPCQTTSVHGSSWWRMRTQLIPQAKWHSSGWRGWKARRDALHDISTSADASQAGSVMTSVHPAHMTWWQCCNSGSAPRQYITQQQCHDTGALSWCATWCKCCGISASSWHATWRQHHDVSTPSWREPTVAWYTHPQWLSPVCGWSRRCHCWRSSCRRSAHKLSPAVHSPVLVAPGCCPVAAKQTSTHSGNASSLHIIIVFIHSRHTATDIHWRMDTETSIDIDTDMNTETNTDMGYGHKSEPRDQHRQRRTQL